MVSELTTYTIVKQLRERILDIGILAIPLDDDKLQEYPLYTEEFVLFDSSSKIAARNKNTIDLDSIDYNRFWLMEESPCLSRQVVKICDLNRRAHGTIRNFEFKAGSIDSLIRFVKENNGVTLLPYLSTLDMSGEDRQKVSFFEKKIPSRAIGIIMHKHCLKKRILELLKMEIQDKVVPLLHTHSKQRPMILPV